jgi:DNA-binding NarL/FixJ family response regulator
MRVARNRTRRHPLPVPTSTATRKAAQQPAIRILFVDDDEMMRIFFRDVFWIHGAEHRYDLQIASTVDEAEKILRDPEKRPSIVFMDLVMEREVNGHVEKSPDVGFGLLKEITTDPSLKGIKAVVFSGHSEEEFKREAAQLGAAAYLVKGEQLPKELLECVNSLVNTT